MFPGKGDGARTEGINMGEKELSTCRFHREKKRRQRNTGKDVKNGEPNFVSEEPGTAGGVMAQTFEVFR